MTSFFSLILVIVMAFTSIGGMTANLEETSSFDVKVSADAATVMALTGTAVTEETQGTAKVIEDILGSITLKGTADKETTELALFAGTDVLLSLGVKNIEGGYLFASSLLGDKTLTITKELIEQTQQQMMGSVSQSATSGMDLQSLSAQMETLDKEQVSKDGEEIYQKLKAEIDAKYGEPESGEFTVDGMTFVTKTPVNISYAELTELVLNAVKELLGKESMQPIVQAAGQGTDINASIDEALEKVKNQPEEERPEVQLSVYKDADECEYIVCDAATKGSEDGSVKAENIHAAGGTIDGKERVLITSNTVNFDMTTEKAEDGSGEMQMKLTGDGMDISVVSKSAADQSTDATCDMNVQGMPVKAHFVTTKEGERTNFQAEIYMMDKLLLTLSGSAGKGGEMVSAFEGGEITNIPFEKLMDTNDTTTANQIQMVMMSSLLSAITTLSKNVPEDTAAWLTSQLAAMMNPGSSTEGE